MSLEVYEIARMAKRNADILKDPDVTARMLFDAQDELRDRARNACLDHGIEWGDLMAMMRKHMHEHPH